MPLGYDMMESSDTVSKISCKSTIAVDAYATRVLKEQSGPEACIDDSLGPYVTSLLRSSLESCADDDITRIPEYESLMELLEEHCNLSEELAKSTLRSIVFAVRTGNVGLYQVPSLPNRPNSGNDRHLGGSSIGSIDVGSPWATSMGSEGELGMESLFLLNKSLQEENIVKEQRSLNAFSVSQEHQTQNYPYSFLDSERENITPGAGTTFNGNGMTPLKPDHLIPVDLLGVLDDPPTPGAEKGKVNPAFLGSLPPASKTSNSVHGKGKKHSKKAANDLAAALFRSSSRSRQCSFDDTKSPKLKPSSTPYSTPFSSPADPATRLFQQQIDSAIEILLSMNADLGGEAAAEAALVANRDVNIAQYVIDGAISASPVCRHMLNAGCYRSDCQFSHDVEGHTCLFWLRGRCGKGAECRFMHGFGEKLLDGINKDLLKDQQDGEKGVNNGFSLNGSGKSSCLKSAPLPIRTANLTERNTRMPISATNNGSLLSGSRKSVGLKSDSLPIRAANLLIEQKTSLSYSAPTHKSNPFTFMSPSKGLDSKATTFSPEASSVSCQGWSREPDSVDSTSKIMVTNDYKGAPKSDSSFSFAKITSNGNRNASFSSPSSHGGIGDALAASASIKEPSRKNMNL